MTDYPPVSEFLPHDKPMILIDRMLDVQEKSVHCQADISVVNLFYDPLSRMVPAYTGIEMMAQSVAAWSGYHARQRGSAPQVGFLLGSRRYSAECDHFDEGQRLDIYAEQVLEDKGMAVFNARIQSGQQVLATCQLNVFVPPKEKLKSMTGGIQR